MSAAYCLSLGEHTVVNALRLFHGLSRLVILLGVLGRR